MIDHGTSDNKFLCYNDSADTKDDEITPEDLKGWLDSLQNNLESKEIDCNIVVILGFCYSGGFVETLSRENRIIISSSSPDEPSYKGPMDPYDEVRQGEFFIDAFFSQIGEGLSIGKSFIAASEAAWRWSVELNNYDHFFKSQNPLLDDNGDAKASSADKVKVENLDGHLSQNLYIGTVSKLNISNNSENARIIKVSDTIFLSSDQESILLTAIVNNSNRVKTSWIEVKTPDFTIREAQNNSEQIEMDLPGTTYCKIDKNIYLWDNLYFTYDDHLSCQEKKTEPGDFGLFSTPGTYLVYYFAKDNDTDQISPLISTTVYKNKPDNSPPEPVTLQFPYQDLTTQTNLIFHWYHASDPENDRITYTLMLSKNDDNFTNPDTIIIEDLNDNSYQIKLKAEGEGNWDMKTIFWKVIAIDYYGLRSESEIWSFETDNRANSGNAKVKFALYYTASCSKITRLSDIKLSVKSDDSLKLFTVFCKNNIHSKTLYCDKTYQLTATSNHFLTQTIQFSLFANGKDINNNINSLTCFDGFTINLFLLPDFFEANDNNKPELIDVLACVSSIVEIHDETLQKQCTMSDLITLLKLLSIDSCNLQ